MKCEETFHLDRNFVRVVITGVGHDKHATLESIRNLRLDPRFRPDIGILVDSRAAEMTVSKSESYSVGLVLSQMFPNHKIACVANQKNILDALHETKLHAQAKVQMRVFTDIEKAEAWLCSSKGSGLVGESTISET